MKLCLFAIFILFFISTILAQEKGLQEIKDEAKQSIQLETKSAGASGSLVTRLCPTEIAKTTLAMENDGVACIGFQKNSIFDLSLVVFNKSKDKIKSTLIFHAHDQMANEQIGEQITTSFAFDTGYNAYPLTDIFGSKENIQKLIPFASNSNPAIISVTIIQSKSTSEQDSTNCTGFVGGGSALNLSISISPIMPAFILNKNETNFSTLIGPASVSVGYQYINKHLNSFGISGVLVAKDKLDTNNVASFQFWPGVALSASKLTPRGIRYSIDLIAAYDFVKKGNDNLVTGAAINFGVDLVKAMYK